MSGVLKRYATSLTLAALTITSACASTPKAPAGAPAFPEFPALEVPAALRVSQAIRDQHAAAGRLLQGGDLRAAGRAYSAILRTSPSFYPSETGLGFVSLADRSFKPAAARFRSALGQDNRYAPAWRGLVEAELGAGNTDEAIAALERLIALDGAREADKARLELLHFKQVQSLIDGATRAREAGRLEEADGLFTRALGLAPSSTAILRELAEVEVARGDLDEAELHARRAVDLDTNDAGAHGALASVLTGRGRLAEAAAQLDRAAALDPTHWRDRALAARSRAGETGGPVELREIATAASVTRGQLAALIDLKLEAVLARAPRRVPDVATDTRGHWAASQIMAVTQAGVMDVFANHTFQPATTVRRADLADAAAKLVALALAAKADQLARWQSARPALADVSPSNLFYPSAALAVTSGAMALDAGRFQPTRAATGAEVLAVLARIDELGR